MKNNIRYKGNTNNTSVIIFLTWSNPTKTPSDGTLLGRTSQEDFCCYFVFISFLYLNFIFDLHFVVVVLHLSLFFIYLLFDVIVHPSVDYRRVFTPILYFQRSPSQSDSRHCHFQAFRNLLTASATLFEWAFFTHRRFLPYAPSMTFLTEPAFIKASLGADSFSLKFSRLYTDP